MVAKKQSSLTEFYHNKRILITGASGYIAWNLIKQLAEYNCTLVCFSRSADIIEREKGDANFKFIVANYQDEVAWQKAVKNIDIVYHLASQTSVYEAEKDPLADYEANVKPIQLLLDACRKEETCPIIVFSGTSTQCGMPNKLPVDENVVDDPITTYDFNKLQAERWLKFYTRQGLVKGVSFRLTNVYGPGPRSSNADRGILNLMIKQALNGGKLTIYGKGEFVRDYIYIDDVVNTFLSAPLYINDFNKKHLILGSGEGNTIKEAVHKVGKLVTNQTGIKVVIENIDMPMGMAKIEFRNFIAETKSLYKIGLCNKMISLNQGIKKTVEYYCKGNKDK